MPRPRRPRARFPWALMLPILASPVVAVATLLPVIADAAPAGPPPALGPVLDRMIRDDGVPAVTVLVFSRGRLLYRVDAGVMDRDARLRVASASKWMAAALIMTVVDEGKLSLDEPIGRRLPDFTGEAGAITLRQLLSFTSGQGGLKGLVDVRQDPRISLAESARRIAAIPLQDKPGSVFRYGSPALQVAGALVEQATGQSWSRLFDERIGRPLELGHTAWGNPLRPDVAPAYVHNPNLQGGAVTTAEDYGKFLTMLASGGLYRGRRILSAHAVELMETVQTAGVPVTGVPSGPRAGLQYGLGNWCEAAEGDGSCTMVSSPGAFGTYPWIDRRNDVYGLFFMNRRLPLVEKDVLAARRIIVQAAVQGVR